MIFETVFPTSDNIWLHVVQLTEFLRECNVALICEASAAEYDDPILCCYY